MPRKQDSRFTDKLFETRNVTDFRKNISPFKYAHISLVECIIQIEGRLAGMCCVFITSKIRIRQEKNIYLESNELKMSGFDPYYDIVCK